MDYKIIIYVFFSFLLLYLGAKISYRFELVDNPSKRKIHSKAVAYTGGIIISIILIISTVLFEISNNNLKLLLSMAFLISIIGLIDDKFDLTVGSKLSLQIIPIFYLIIFENLGLNNLGDYYYFKLNLGTFSLPFTLICVLFLINAFNYFDGMDGTLSLTSISVLGILYFLVPNNNFQFFLFLIFIPIAIFLIFNFSYFKLPKMFLGDSGSLFLGFIISFILIYLASQNLIHPILLAWSIAIFVYEFLSINFIRLRKKQGIFKAGQDHLHHILFKKTKSLMLTNTLICMINIILFIIGYAIFSFVNPMYSFILFISLFFVYLFIRNRNTLI